MATVAEKLTIAIANQQAEVNRLQAIVDTELPAAKAKLQTLKTLLANVTPAFEAAVVKLETNGIKLDT